MGRGGGGGAGEQSWATEDWRGGEGLGQEGRPGEKTGRKKFRGSSFAMGMGEAAREGVGTLTSSSLGFLSCSRLPSPSDSRCSQNFEPGVSSEIWQS